MIGWWPSRRCGVAVNPVHEARLHLGEDALERHRREVVALVDDHLAVARDQVVDTSLTNETLDHGHVSRPFGLRFPAPRSGRSSWDRCRETSRAEPSTGRGAAGGGPGPASCRLGPRRGTCRRRSCRHPEAPTNTPVSWPRVPGRPAPGPGSACPRIEIPSGSPVRRRSSTISRTPPPKQRLQLLATPAGQSDVIGEILGAGDHPRGERGRQPQALLLVELRILEGRQSLDLVQERRRPARPSRRRAAGPGPPGPPSEAARVRRPVEGRLDGGRSQGVASSSSLVVSLHRTPMTWPVRVASRAIRSTVVWSIRGTAAEERPLVRRTAQDGHRRRPCCPPGGAPCWSGSAIRLPNPPRGSVSWFGKRRS